MYKAKSTYNPYGRLSRYVTPFAYPLPWWPDRPGVRPVVPGTGPVSQAQAVPGARHVSDHRGGPAVSATGPLSDGLGQSATGLRHRGWLGRYRSGYGPPLPWRPMGELGALSSNAMLGLGAVLLGTVGYFVWRKKKK